jgi:hypothetical protein
MEQFFGRQFGQLFGANSNSTATDLAAAVKEAGVEIPKEPKTPEFCTLVV